MNTCSTNKKGFAAQMLAFFGLLPGQTMKDFHAELKILSPEDKEELATLLTAAGYSCDLPQPVASVA